MHLPFLWCVLLVARSDLSLTLIERRSEINVLALEQKEGVVCRVCDRIRGP